jgi:ATP/ADP translocase
MAFKTLDYSLFRGAKELVYLPLSFDGRYRTKELIDVFGYRSGKAVSSLGIAALQKTGLELSVWFLPAAFALGTLWMGLTLPMTSMRKTTLDDQASANFR